VTEYLILNRSLPSFTSLSGYASILKKVFGRFRRGLRRPRVSVVLPNYNYARSIEGRLASIDQQSYPPFEIIVLDDASTDGSVALIEAAAPQLRARMELICNAENSGRVFSQWVKGVAAAKGDLVWIAEADDLSEPLFLERLVAAFEDSQVVMAYSQSRQIGLDGEILMETYQPYLAEVDDARWLASYTVLGGEECGTSLAVMNTIPNVSACLFRREALAAALQQEGPDFGGLRVAGDWLIYLGVLARGKLHFCAETLNAHRVHNNSVTRSALKSEALVREVGAVQQQARRRFAVQAEYEAKARAYLQKLYEFFGVASPEYPNVFDHPNFTTLKD
jgi:glycosyltransferase involved in cell wall biosynthesis